MRTPQRSYIESVNTVSRALGTGPRGKVWISRLQAGLGSDVHNKTYRLVTEKSRAFYCLCRYVESRLGYKTADDGYN